MLAFLEISINIILFGVVILSATAFGFLVNTARINKQKHTILKLEAEMLQNHAEILHLQKELSGKESNTSKTPIFSIADNTTESLKEQLPGTRLSKKISGGGKSTS